MGAPKPIVVRQAIIVGRSLPCAAARADARGGRINWTRVESLRPCGGIRIEDDLAVTATGSENLTRDALRALGGAVARPADSADTRALQALNAKIHRDERVDMVLLPFSDGVTLARKR